jgi:hypothetical protein
MNGKPPIEYLGGLSRMALGEFELRRLSQVANLRKEIRVAALEILEAIWNTPIAQECIERKAEAMLARWLIEYREQLVSPKSAIGAVPSEEFFDAESGTIVDADPVLGLVDRGRANVQKAG